MTQPQIIIRQADERDADALRRLAATDRRPPLAGPLLVATAAGIPYAAIALGSGAVVADRSRPTLQIVRLLRRHRYRVLRQGADVAPSRALLRRLGRPALGDGRSVVAA